MAKKSVTEVKDLKTIEEVQKFREEILRPMEPSEEKKKLRSELRSKVREIFESK